MRRRPLRRRPALRISEVGFGASQGGNLYRTTSDEEFAGAVQAAWDAGIRYFDTAPHYGLGLSERRLGAALRSRPRDQYVVSTKVGRLLVPTPENAHLRDPEGFDVPADHRRVWDFSRDGVLRSLEDSLERLGLDRIDVVYLHDPDDHWSHAASAAVPALVELRDQGVIGAVGAGMNQSRMLARFIRETDVDLVLCAGRYTLLEQGALLDLMPAAQACGVDVVVGGVYNSGLLASPRPQAGARYDYQRAAPELIERVRRIAAVCETYRVSLPEAALAYVRSHPAVVATVVGMRDGAQVAEACQRFGSRVPGELWTALEAAGLIETVPTG